MKLLIVIVNFRTPELVIECLHSLETELEGATGAGLRTIEVDVIDNVSDDGSLDKIQAAIEDEGWSWVRARCSGKNGGFSFGNNRAIEPALASDEPPDYVLLLNPDTVVRPGGVLELVRFLNEHPQIGIAGSRLEEPDGTVQHSRYRFFSLPGEFDAGLRFGPVSRLLSRWVIAPPLHDEPHEIGWVAGASMLVRREVFRDVGLMDEDYFLYFEETDLCLAAKRAGWPTWYVPSSRVVHLVGQSSGIDTDDMSEKPMPRFWFESRRRYFAKNHGTLYAVLADLIYGTAFGLWRIRRAIQRKPDLDPPHFLRDLLRFNLRPVPIQTRQILGRTTASESQGRRRAAA